jgi:hypothetical protein
MHSAENENLEFQLFKWFAKKTQLPYLFMDQYSKEKSTFSQET